MNTMQHLGCSGECCPNGRGHRGSRGGSPRGRGKSGKRGSWGGWDDQGFNQSSATWGASYHQYPGGCDHVNYPQFGAPNYNGGAKGGYAGSGQEYPGAAGCAGHSDAGYGYSPNPGTANEPCYHGYDYSGFNEVGRGGVGRGYVGYPAHHGVARRGQGFNGKFRAGRNGGSGHQDFAGAKSGDAGVRGQRGARRRGVGRRGYARGGRGYRGGHSNKGRSVSSHRSNTTVDSDGESNTEGKNGRSKQRPARNRSDDKGERKKGSKDANVREKIHSKTKNPENEKDRRSGKQKSDISNRKGKSPRKSRYDGNSDSSRSSDSRSSSTASSTASSDSSSQSSSGDSSDSSDGSSSSTASSRNSSASSNYQSKTASTNRNKRYSRDDESSNKHEKSCRCKKCKERCADNTVRKSKSSNEKNHDTGRSSKTSSRRREGGSVHRQRRSKDEYDSSDLESENDSKPTSRSKHEERSSNKSRDYVNDRKNPSKSNTGAAANPNEYRNEPSERDNSAPRTSSSASATPTKKNRSSAELPSNTTTPRLSSLTHRNKQNAGTTSSSPTTTPRLASPTPRNKQNAETTSSTTTTPRLVALTPRNTQNAGTTPSPVIRYEWQFQDNQGSWITYGQSNTKKGSGSATTASSDDIETHYSNDPARSPVQIQSNSYQYVLDFQSMTQTNTETSVQRPIRRILKQAVKPAVLPKKDAVSNGFGTTSSTAGVYYEWQFKDERGAWIRYGSPTTGGDLSSVTTTSSDDIEKYFSSDPDKSPLLIQSNSHQYILDFQTMTQTNQNTLAQRQIRRVLQQAAKPTVKPKLINIQYEWQFQDEHGAWVPYGIPNTDGDLSCVTTTSSDDIEKHYSSDPMKTSLLIQSKSHQYLLDFQAMTQTNQSTFVQRSIRRVAIQPGKRIVTKSPRLNYFGVGASNCLYEWQFQDENGGWIRYGSPNSGGDLSCVTKITSDDIEKHYSTRPNRSLATQSNSHRYLLDFQSMTQTNQTTMSRRPIRRVPTQPLQNTRTLLASLNRKYFDSRSAASNGRQSTVAYEWFFLDENNSWIPYGQPNSLNKTDCVTSASSDDIEKQYQQNPHQTIDIASQKHTYSLDFVNMTQTNKQTLVVRSISRRQTTRQGFSASGRRSDLNSQSPVNSDSLPSNWTSMAHSSSAWTAVPLSPIDHEYIKHVGIIKQAVPTFKVRQMYRIQNPFLWKAYVNKKDYMNKQNPSTRFREEYLYHGTDPKNIKAICEENIDWRLHGTNHGQSQGRGAYFAKSPQLATKYSGQQGVVFIVKVLVGHTTTGSATIVKPPKDRSGKPCDTTVDNETNPSIFVKYDTQEYYPEYYVEF